MVLADVNETTLRDVTDDLTSAGHQALGVAAASRAENTWKAYESDLKHFAGWCAELGVIEPVPAEPRLVAAYLAEHAGHLARDACCSAGTIAMLPRRQPFQPLLPLRRRGRSRC